MVAEFKLFSTIFEIIGVMTYCISGSMVAIEKRVDAFGVVLLGLFTAFGGGLFRDLFMGITPPSCFSKPLAVTIGSVTSVIVFIIVYILKQKYLDIAPKIDKVINVFDALGLGLFTISGIDVAISNGFADRPIFCIAMGLTTAIGGGLIRDLTLRQIPFVIKKHVYALASIAGGVIYVAMVLNGIRHETSFLVSAAVIFVFRMLATIFHWNLPKAI